MVTEAATKRLLQPGGLGTQAGCAPCGPAPWDRAPRATSAASIARPDTPKLSLATTQRLIWASSSSLSTRCCSAVRPATRSAR
jgi:hypothetical protein